MKKIAKKIVALLTIFTFSFATFIPYLAYAETTPIKGDLRYQGTTSYIEADSDGLDIGLVTKNDQYTSINGKSVEVSAGLFNNAENNDVTTINELSENDVEVRKIVTKLNNDGKYQIDFQVRGKGTKLQVKAPVYVVVVFDNSNSMAPEQESKGTCSNWKSARELKRDKGRCYDKWDKAINGAKDFAEIIHNNIPSANIALVSFAGKKNNSNYSDSNLIRDFSASDFTGLNESSSFKINMPVYEQAYSSGGTNLEAGLRRARQLLSNTNNTNVVPSNALKYVVVMSDGEPSYYYNNKGTTNGSGSGYDSTAHSHAVTEATNIKKNLNGKIYSIGYEVPSNGKAEIVLNDISSNTKNNDGTYSGGFYASGSVETIANKFTDIATEIVKDAGINAYINDNIGAAFTGSGTGVSDDGKTYESQIIPSIYEKWTSLGSFTIQIDPDSPTGWYKTNNGFTLTYYDVVNEQTRVIECNDNPEVYWVQNTYNYEVRFYYEDGSGNYVEDTSLAQNLKAAHNETVSELTSEIMDSQHLKEGYLFETVKNGSYETINEFDNKYSIVVDKNSDTNVIRVYYKKAFTLSITKLVEDYDEKNPSMNKDFQFEIKLTDNSSDNPITGTYLYKLNNETDKKEIVFNQSGIGTFNLKHNDKITFINLPRNLKYEITELNSEGYFVEITYPDGSSDINTTTGILSLDRNQEVGFLNITGYILPETGNSGGLIFSIVIMVLLGTPIVYLIYSFVNKRYASWYL